MVDGPDDEIFEDLEADISMVKVEGTAREKENNKTEKVTKVPEVSILPKMAAIINALILRPSINKSANKGKGGRIEQEPINLHGNHNSEQ